MAIKHYGLDATEIEHLRAVGLDDEEINAVNEKRVKAQVEEKEEWHSEDDVISSYIKKMPNTPKVIASFVFARLGDSAADDTLREIDTFFRDNKSVCNAVTESLGKNSVDYDAFSLHQRDHLLDNYMEFAFPTEVITEAMRQISSKHKDFPEILATNPFFEA